MKANYILKIENPCNESWGKMEKIDAGRHCQNCNKDVIDFSNTSDDEIIKYLSKNSFGKTCGRLEPYQLDRILKVNNNKKSKFSKVITALILIGAAKTSLAQDQQNFKKQATVISEGKIDARKINISEPETNQDSLARIIEGVVIAEEDKLPLTGVSVKIKGTNSGAITNPEGKFKLFIPENLQGEKIELYFRHLGFKQLLVKMKPADFKGHKEFKMCTDDALMGEVIIVSAKKKWWKFWKRK